MSRPRIETPAGAVPVIGKPKQPKQPHVIVDQAEGPPLLLPGVIACMIADGVLEQIATTVSLAVSDLVAKRVLDELTKHGVIAPNPLLGFSDDVRGALEVRA